jgi:2-keto-4-pentenoate hydratase/2-oxohepta-3-ene-1,7-dioic acid hydratase in catechol pathway
MQRSNTSDMIFSVAKIISHLSQDVTLLRGTVIITGTPEVREQTCLCSTKVLESE